MLPYRPLLSSGGNRASWAKLLYGVISVPFLYMSKVYTDWSSGKGGNSKATKVPSVGTVILIPGLVTVPELFVALLRTKNTRSTSASPEKVGGKLPGHIGLNWALMAILAGSDGGVSSGRSSIISVPSKKKRISPPVW